MKDHASNNFIVVDVLTSPLLRMNYEETFTKV